MGKVQEQQSFNVAWRTIDGLNIRYATAGRSDETVILLSPWPEIEAFGLTPVHAVGPDVGTPSLLFASLARPELFRSLVVGAGAATPIPGTLRVAHLEENVAAASVSLKPQEIAELDTAA